MKGKVADLEKELETVKFSQIDPKTIANLREELKEEEKEYAILQSDFQKLQTNHDIQQIDLQNRNQQIHLLEEKLADEAAKLPQIEAVSDKLKQELSDAHMGIEKLEEYNRELKVLNEQLQIENSCKDDSCKEI